MGPRTHPKCLQLIRAATASRLFVILSVIISACAWPFEIRNSLPDVPNHFVLYADGCIRDCVSHGARCRSMAFSDSLAQHPDHILEVAFCHA